MSQRKFAIVTAFFDQEPAERRHVVDTNITGTVDPIQQVASRRWSARTGRLTAQLLSGETFATLKQAEELIGRSARSMAASRGLWRTNALSANDPGLLTWLIFDRAAIFGLGNDV